MDHSEHEHSSAPRAFHWVLCGFIVVAGFFLITEHRAHLYGFLPYAFLLACPLMHMFMHRGHGGHHHHDQGAGASSDRQDKDAKP